MAVPAQRKAPAYRYIIVGETEVGKSSIMLQFTERQFRKDSECTLGVEMGSRNVLVDGQDVKLVR